MNSNDDRLVERLKSDQAQRGWGQVDAAVDLGVSQGHLSKILSGKASISNKFRVRADVFLASSDAERSAFEIKVIAKLRQSKAFHELVSAAMRMHKNA